jgi:hypothetical protein
VKGSTRYGNPGTYATQREPFCVADVCTEGCNTDADCYPNRTPDGSKVCHVGGGLNLDHKCVECSCNTLSADGTYCEGAGQTGCTGNEVCDASALTCRKKRLGETCSAGAECGDLTDPELGGCIGSSAACIFSVETGPVGAGTAYCSATANVGRCGIPCDDPQDNMCNSGASLSCPSGSACTQTVSSNPENAGGPSSGKYCAPSSCSIAR